MALQLVVPVRREILNQDLFGFRRAAEGFPPRTLRSIFVANVAKHFFSESGVPRAFLLEGLRPWQNAQGDQSKIPSC
jgi:hypothetical protein